ncbi:hypothetical protein MKX01_030337 [Papaver californicum]|nr:hypothetical protein MKX01_030337 [Papaver californicum]
MKSEDFCLFEYVEEKKCQVIIFDRSNGCERDNAFHVVPSRASSNTPSATTSKGKEKAVEDEAEPHPEPFASQRRDVTNEDLFVALDAAFGFQSVKPFTLLFPISFLKESLTAHNEATMNVRDPHGRAWHVHIATSEDGKFGQLGGATFPSPITSKLMSSALKNSLEKMSYSYIFSGSSKKSNL